MSEFTKLQRKQARYHSAFQQNTKLLQVIGIDTISIAISWFLKL